MGESFHDVAIKMILRFEFCVFNPSAAIVLALFNAKWEVGSI
jgi:hypothetical protein